MKDINERCKELIAAFRKYAEHRKSFLDCLGLSGSNRDPLVEFPEVLVAGLHGGTLAPSRVQEGWDVELPDRTRIQVKSLANSHPEYWVNEHYVDPPAKADLYALVVYRGLDLESVLMFDKKHFEALRAKLGCLSDDGPGFNLTERRYDLITDNLADFKPMGVTVHWYGEG